MPPWEKYQSKGPWSKYQAPQESQRTAVDAGEALLTNLPTQGIKQDIVRGLPATALSIPGATAGAAAGAKLGGTIGTFFGPGPGTAVGAGIGGVIGGIAGAGLGGAAGEAVRQAVSQGVAAKFPEERYPILNSYGVLRNTAAQGLSQAAGEGFGMGAGAVAKGALKGIRAAAPVVAKTAANVPEASTAAAVNDLGMLGRAPSREAVGQAYDEFHKASGTMSRKEAVSRSDDPFDTVSRAMNTMRDASNKLRAGTLTTQEAVEASQAGRIIRDMKRRGVEMAQQVADQADDLKHSFDGFIQKGLTEKRGMQTFAKAQEIIPSATSRPVAQEIIPQSVNVPSTETVNLLPQLKKIVEVVKRANAEGLNPKAILTESERELYDRFKAPIGSAAEFNVGIGTLLTKADVEQAMPAFVEGVAYRPGKMLRETSRSMKPGKILYGEREVVERPAIEGYESWQKARQMAFENSVAEDFGYAVPRNVNGQPNVLRTWSAVGGGATAGAATGAVIAGPAGALIGGGLGALGGAASVSPMMYGTAIRGLGVADSLVNGVPGAIYRVAPQAGAGAAGSALSVEYFKRRQAAYP